MADGLMIIAGILVAGCAAIAFVIWWHWPKEPGREDW